MQDSTRYCKVDPSNPRVSSSPARSPFPQIVDDKTRLYGDLWLICSQAQINKLYQYSTWIFNTRASLFQAARLSVKLKNNITLSDTSHNQKKIAWISTYILLWSSLSKYDDELIILDIRPEYLFLKCFVRRDLFLKYLIRQGGHIYHNFLIYQYMTSSTYISL